MKKVRNCIIILAASIFTGLILLVLVFLLPVSSKNVKQSAYMIAGEDIHQRMGVWQLDNYTDAYMLNHAFFKNPGADIFDRALNVYVFKYSDGNEKPPLARLIDGDEGYLPYEYSRYWHGYLLYLKPLLMIFDYNEIRILNTCIQILLFCYLCFLLNKKGLKKYILVYALMYFLISPIATGFSLQYSSIYYVGIVTTIIFLRKYQDIKAKNYFIELFFLQGVLIVYFDYLTYPVFALGLLLLTYLLCKIDDGETASIIHTIRDIFIYSVMWSLGYVIMWASKWIIASLYNGSFENIKMALREIVFRSAPDAYGESLSALDVIVENILQYKSPVFLLAVLIFIVLIFYKKKFAHDNVRLRNMLLCCFISLYPLVWYAAFKNHSYIHAWFASKSLAISLGAFICGLMQFIKQDENDICQLSE